MEGRGGVAGEIRRLNIIYCLCCMGLFDHPHLIRVDHLNRNGVFLRAIKRRLTDLRGKGMSWPETFTWSYKRRYNHVWEDLLDDDLITPVSDNGNVLKGSQTLSHSSFESPHSYIYAAEKKNRLLKQLQPPNSSEEAANQMHQVRKTCFKTDQEPPPHNSGNVQGDSSTIKTNSTNHEQSKNKSSIEDSRFCSNLLLKKKKKIKSYNYKDSKEMGSSTTSCSSSCSPHNSSPQSQSVPVGKSSKRRHLSMFRNLINCGAVNTNDAAHVRLNRDSNSSKDIIIRKEMRENAGTVGSAGLFRTCMDQQKHQNHTCATASKRADEKNQKTSSAYRPIRWPHCSHCRKQFKPEKLYSHMKSCKGMKALSETAPAPVSKMP